MDGWKFDSLELINDVRFRLDEPVLPITLDKVDGDFRHRQTDLDVEYACASPQSQVTISRFDGRRCPKAQKGGSGGGTCSVSVNKLNGAISSIRAGPVIMRGC